MWDKWMYFNHKIIKFDMLLFIGLIFLINLSATHLQPHGES